MSALAGVTGRIDDLLAGPDAAAAKHFRGDDGSRQPVHSVYVPGHRFTAQTTTEWGARAREAVATAGGIGHLLDVHGLVADPGEKDLIGSLVMDKLEHEPVEDLRIDFEDGFGDQGDEIEDAAVRAAARAITESAAAGTLPPFVGIRFKSFQPDTRERGLRTLELFVTELVKAGPLPDGLILTLPMVTSVAQIEAMVIALEALEAALGLDSGRLGFEIQIETPQAILGPDGVALIGPMIAAGQGRITGMPYGTYDYSASLGIAAAHQALDHPGADYAKSVMQVSAAGTGVRLSDGSTNVIPMGTPEAVDAAWSLHGGLVNRSLVRGFYQGWDLHPAHLPSRFAATYAFFRAALPDALRRLDDYVSKREGAVMDEPATATAMAWFVLRGLDCGAVDPDELPFGTEVLRGLMQPGGSNA